MQRLTASHEEKVKASPDTIYGLFVDWAGVGKMSPKADSPVPVQKIELIGKHGEIPRGRRIHFVGHSFVETLIMEDPVTRRIYYTLENDGIPGIRNYLATTTFDDAGDGCTLVRFSSTSDIVNDAAPEAMRAFFVSVYQHLGRGLREMFGPAN